MSRGKEVKELREKMGMNRREFSDYYGIPYRTIQDWEAKKRELPDYLLRLLKYRAEIKRRIKSEDNRKEKHSKDAKYGWYSYDSRFALPVFGDDGEIERYNVFNVAMLVRHDEDGKYYLYDIMKIKKETSNLFQSNDFTQ